MLGRIEAISNTAVTDIALLQLAEPARSAIGSIRLPASMEPIPKMSEDENIKGFLRFTSKGELIRLAEIGLAVEMHQAAQRFFHGRTDVPYTEETAAKLQAYLELNSGGSCSPQVTGTIQGDTQSCLEGTHHETF